MKADPIRNQLVAGILAERQRQVDVEGFDAAHDDQPRQPYDLAKAAACYAEHATLDDEERKHPPAKAPGWPWDAKWWKPKDRFRDLIRAGALILAELERMTRRMKPSVTGPTADVKVQVGSKALAKIIDRAQKNGAEVVDASGLLTALAERAKAEIGAIMIAHNHATLSYERLEDGTFAMVARVFDQKIVVRLSDDPDDGGKVIPIDPKTKNPWPGDADEFRDGRPQEGGGDEG